MKAAKLRVLLFPLLGAQRGRATHHRRQRRRFTTEAVTVRPIRGHLQRLALAAARHALTMSLVVAATSAENGGATMLKCLAGILGNRHATSTLVALAATATVEAVAVTVGGQRLTREGNGSRRTCRGEAAAAVQGAVPMMQVATTATMDVAVARPRARAAAADPGATPATAQEQMLGTAVALAATTMTTTRK